MQYYLFLVLDEAPTSYFLSNKQFIQIGSLLELDEITGPYQDAQDLGMDLYAPKQITTIKKAIILSEKEVNKLKKNNWYMLPRKCEFVLFQEDLEFLQAQLSTQKNQEMYNEQLIYNYKNYLLNHKGKIKDSLVKNVKLGIEINASISGWELDQVFYAYYKNNSYKKMRDTYFELKKLKTELVKMTSYHQIGGAEKNTKKYQRVRRKEDCEGN